jgi:hypothetical protein
MMPKEMHGVKPCLLENATRQEPQNQPLLQKRQVCFSKLSGRHTIKFLGVIALVAVIAFTVIACGGGSDPKSLAKQTYQVFEKTMKAEGKEASDMAFILWSMSEPKELNAIVAKVEALSANDQKAYEAELEKLLEGKK